MTLEAYYRHEGEAIDYTPSSALTGGQVIQLADGREAVAITDMAAGAKGAVGVVGVYRLEKTTSMVILDGGRVYWDHSANKAHYKKVNDRDFYVGRAVGDASSSATTVDVAINIDPPADIDVLRDAALSVATGTAAAGGFGLPGVYGGARGLLLTATSQVQCVDILSVDRFAVGANAIVEAIFRVGVNGSTSDVDFNIGVANGTSTSDADAVTEHCYVHIDGGALDIYAQSKDGTTTVAAVDTTINATAGSAVSDRIEVWFDLRDPSDIQIYINGANVLPATVFRLDAATGPLGLLAHLEKANGTATAGPIYIDRLCCRLMEQ